MLDRIFDRYRRLCTVLTGIGLALLLCTSLLLALEVVLRKLFLISIGGADELAGYMFAILTAFAFSVAAIEKANIRIDVLYNCLSRSLRIALDLLAQIALLIFVVPLTWAAVKMMINSFEKGSRAITPLATPLAIPQSIWAGALVVLLLTLILILMVSVAALFRGDIRRFNRMASPVSEVEEGEKTLKELDLDPGAQGAKPLENRP